MDGLTVSNSDLSVRGGESLARAKESKAPSPDLQGGSDFVSTLKDAIGSVNQLQKDADIQTQKLITGQSSNLHETMIASEKAEIALRLLTQVRNKVIEAYQEIMRMQV